MLQSDMATQTQAVASEAPRQYILNASHRCDACSAAAQFLIVMEDGREWLLCLHHHRDHGEKLGEKALSIIDESDRLLVKLSSSA